MNELWINLIVSACGLVATFFFLKYVKPWMDKHIDTEEEKKTYYKAKKMVQIAHDLIAQYVAHNPAIGLKVVDELIDTFMEICDIDDREIATRILESAYTDIKAKEPVSTSKKK